MSIVRKDDLMMSIDIGLRATAVAIFVGRELVFTVLVDNPEQTIRGMCAWKAMKNAFFGYFDKTREWALAVVQFAKNAFAIGNLKAEQVERIVLAVENVSFNMVIEKPIQYSRFSFKGSGVAQDVAEIQGIYRQFTNEAKKRNWIIQSYIPSAWKGNTSKTVTKTWVKNEISEVERAALSYNKTGASRHGKGLEDIIDAIGIGLYHLGRYRTASRATR